MPDHKNSRPQPARSFGEFFVARASSETEAAALKARVDSDFAPSNPWEFFDDFYLPTEHEVKIPHFASVEKTVHTLREENIFPLILDRNVRFSTQTYMLGRGLGAIHIIETNLEHATDEILYKTASRLGVPFVTHDKDFLNHHDRFDPMLTAGVVVLPADANGSHSPRPDSIIRKAVIHLTQNFPRDADQWRATFREYTIGGELLIYTAPFRQVDPGSVRSLPTSRLSLE